MIDIEKPIEKFLEKRRPPQEIRDEVDLGYSYENQTVEIFEIRPYFLDASRIIHVPVAKTRYIKKRDIWKIYWMRGNGKWVAYDPEPEVKTIDEFLAIVDEDTHAAFFG